MTTVARHRAWGGVQGVYRHDSRETGCPMTFALFLPSLAMSERVPAVYWLSGLTCTHENFTLKAGAQRVAAELGLALVVPDTSPRGLGYPGEDDAYDFGTGAGFYVDATVEPWAGGYRMASYVARELPEIVAEHFSVEPARAAISGHSMGGHGALTLALKHPGFYVSVSAFAPIASAMQSPWGEKALTGYLGPDREAWRDYDAVSVLESRGWTGPPILIDQGTADEFADRELRPTLLVEAAARARVPLEFRWQDGYDHSYYFIATFIDDHLRRHAAALGASQRSAGER